MRICPGGAASFRISEVFSIAGGEKIGRELMKNSGKNLMRKSLLSKSERGAEKAGILRGNQVGAGREDRSHWRVMK